MRKNISEKTQVDSSSAQLQHPHGILNYYSFYSISHIWIRPCSVCYKNHDFSTLMLFCLYLDISKLGPVQLATNIVIFLNSSQFFEILIFIKYH